MLAAVEAPEATVVKLSIVPISASSSANGMRRSNWGATDRVEEKWEGRAVRRGHPLFCSGIVIDCFDCRARDGLRQSPGESVSNDAEASLAGSSEMVQLDWRARGLPLFEVDLSHGCCRDTGDGRQGQCGELVNH